MRNWYQSAISPFQREGSPEGPGAARGQGGLATVGWQGVKGCVVDVGGVGTQIARRYLNKQDKQLRYVSLYYVDDVQERIVL